MEICPSVAAFDLSKIQKVNAVQNEGDLGSLKKRGRKRVWVCPRAMMSFQACPGVSVSIRWNYGIKVYQFSRKGVSGAFDSRKRGGDS